MQDHHVNAAVPPEHVPAPGPNFAPAPPLDPLTLRWTAAAARQQAERLRKGVDIMATNTKRNRVAGAAGALAAFADILDGVAVGAEKGGGA